MLGRMRAMAFVPVADLERAATFYGSVLGLDLVSSVPGVVCVFDAGGTALRVTAVADHVAAGVDGGRLGRSRPRRRRCGSSVRAVSSRTRIRG